MAKNIQKMQATHGIKNFNFVPTTFILPGDSTLLEEDKEKNPNVIYIVKPAGSSQGKGIYMTEKISEILSKQNNGVIVSHYIENPFLINQLKFDLRIYVLISSINPLRIYQYREGLVRFAVEKFELGQFNNSSKDRCIHLTNYSVNKYNTNFIQNEDAYEDNYGHKWSFTALKELLTKYGINTKLLDDAIEDIIIKTILSIESTIFNSWEQHVPYRNNCFELFGFDILVDNQLKPWLLEVNLSPSLGVDSPLDQKIKGQLLADIFTLLGIVPLDQRLYQNLQPNKAFTQYSSNYGTQLILCGY